jgi:acyl phosphate:glycerol-3-phosphate acyltransferase
MQSLMNLAGVWQFVLIGLALGYLLGSIPFGLLITKLAGTEDIRSIGSGNIGATNVLRTGRKGLAAATLLGDALKGTVAVLLGATWDPVIALFAGLGAFIGHLFPIWLGFKGGKGVATFLGALLGFWWPGALLFAAVWLVIAYLSRFSSLSSLVASATTPVLLYVAGFRLGTGVFLVMTILLFVMHRENIGRLLAGAEGKIGQKA